MGDVEIFPEGDNNDIHLTSIIIVKYNYILLNFCSDQFERCEGPVCVVTDEASADLSSQVDERRENHKQLLEDLDTILDQVSLIWQRIGKSLFSFKSFVPVITVYMFRITAVHSV